MLVLSRRQNQQIVFPNLGIKVQVLRSSRGVVRLGIEAPREVAILRDEVAAQNDSCNIGPSSGEKSEPDLAALPSDLRHAIRNRLNTAFLGLHLLHRKLQTGHLDDAEDAILKVFQELEILDQEVVGSKPTAASSDRSPLGRRVLLVDDNRNESELLAGFLETYDFHVDKAFDGDEALAYLSAHEKPDFVLLDMQMPKLDGMTTIKRIRENRALDGIQVFAVSGLDRNLAGVSLGPSGVDRWFTKPLRPHDLIEEMQRESIAR